MEPNDTTEDISTDVASLVESLPPVIQRYVVEERYTPIARRLAANYRLTITQGVVLEREMLLLITGIHTSREFVDTLFDEAKLESNTIRNIVDVMNTQVFAPIQAEMQREWKEGEDSSRQSPDAESPEPEPLSGGERLAGTVAEGGMAPVFPVPPLPEPPKRKPVTFVGIPQGVYAPPPQSPRYTGPSASDLYVREDLTNPSSAKIDTAHSDRAKNAAVSTRQPAASDAVNLIHKEPSPVEGTVSRDTSRNEPNAVIRAASPTGEVPPSDHLLEDHEEPHFDVGLKKVPSQAIFSSLSPADAAAPVSHESQSRALPIEASVHAESGTISAPKTAARPMVAPPLAVAPAVERYGVDPYREPIDDRS